MTSSLGRERVCSQCGRQVARCSPHAASGGPSPVESVTGTPGPRTRCERGRDRPPVSPNVRAPGNGRLRRHPRAAVTLRVRSRRCQGAGGWTPSRARRRNEVPAGGAGAHHVPGGFARGGQEAPAASSGLPTPIWAPRSPCTCRWSRTLPHEAAMLGDPTAPGHSQALAGHGREGPGSGGEGRGREPAHSPLQAAGPLIICSCKLQPQAPLKRPVSPRCTVEACPAAPPIGE